MFMWLGRQIKRMKLMDCSTYTYFEVPVNNKEEESLYEERMRGDTCRMTSQQ